MATHECTKCLAETIQGISEVTGHLVLPGSICTSGGIIGSHNWTPKGNSPPFPHRTFLQCFSCWWMYFFFIRLFSIYLNIINRTLSLYFYLPPTANFMFFLLSPLLYLKSIHPLYYYIIPPTHLFSWIY